MAEVFYHLCVVKSKLPRSHVPTDGQYFIISHFKTKAKKHDYTFLTMSHWQMIIVLLVFAIYLAAVKIPRGFTDIVQQRSHYQTIITDFKVW